MCSSILVRTSPWSCSVLSSRTRTDDASPSRRTRRGPLADVPGCGRPASCRPLLRFLLRSPPGLHGAERHAIGPDRRRDPAKLLRLQARVLFPPTHVPLALRRSHCDELGVLLHDTHDRSTARDVANHTSASVCQSTDSPFSQFGEGARPVRWSEAALRGRRGTTAYVAQTCGRAACGRGSAGSRRGCSSSHFVRPADSAHRGGTGVFSRRSARALIPVEE
jgi:hypothetical protein